MQVEKYLHILRQMDALIAKAGTGPPGDFARKLGLSERQTRVYLHYLRDKGARISYCRRRMSYVYEEAGRFRIEFSYHKEARTRS